ncbi:MAG: hypothetical protein JNK67_11150 [Alphaproteobacteria bacterium]|nr:hypothetical protein [Alphaproteobacteria bacterium]
MRFSRLLTFLLLGALLAACGNLPRPFQPDDKSVENPLLVLGDRAGIIVMPIAGVDSDSESHGFAEALARALRDLDVNAHTGAGNRASLVLSSFLERKPNAGSVLVLWLSEPGKGDTGTYEANVEPRDILSDGPRRQQVLRKIAEAVAAQVNPGAVAAPLGTPPVFIARIDGLNETTSRPLQRALDYALRRAKLEVADAPGGRTLTLAGRIRFQDRPQNMVALDVDWRVLGVDGAELGTLRQQNEVPARILERSWAEIASAIGENAADGVIDIVNRAPRSERR